MGKRFTYDFEKYPHEADSFAETMRKRGLKNVKRIGNKVSFWDPRPIFSKPKRRKK